MGMGHYERLLFENLFAVADESWRFGITWSGRAPEYFDASALPLRLREASFLGFGTERLGQLPWPLAKRAVAFALRDIKPDLWVSLSLGFPAPGSAPAIYFVHDLPAARFPDEGVLPRWTRRAAHSATAIITPSQFARRELIELLDLPEEKLQVLIHGCEHQHFHPDVAPVSEEALAALGIRSRFVIYVGGFTQRKNVRALLQAWHSVAREYSDLQLVLAGPRAPLQSLADEARAPRVAVAGYLERAALPAVMKAATCLVVPSIYEGFGLPPLEALALGVPVVTTKFGAIPEVVGDCAEYSASGSAEALAAALKKLLADPEKQSRLRRCGPLRAQQFSWPENARQTLKLYERVLS
jgi:alpha-1,3-rhamnosyl/mannosyltransferase